MMKTLSSLHFVVVLFALVFSGCTDDDPEVLQSKAQKNADSISKILQENSATLKFAVVYEHDPQTGDWRLAADTQAHTEGKSFFHVDGTFFFLDGSGSKSYPSDNTPSHELSGFYYFNLEHLVSFEMNTEKERLFLYFKY